jgi:type II secretory pathway pseudopilin PulG
MLEIKHKHKNSEGFSLVEAVAGIGIFVLLVTSVLGVFGAMQRATKDSREQIVLSSLASSYLEIVKNMPYNQVGTASGNPPGILADSTTPVVRVIENREYNIYYEVTYIDDPADGTILNATDGAPNDYKQIKMSIQNITTGVTSKFITNISPKNLENQDGGALLVRIIDAQGNPVPDASVSITTTNGAPAIVLNRTSDNDGRVLEVGLPVRSDAYHIVATKPGYSTDSTYPITALNPNPVKPDGTIAAGQVTSITLAIDLLSSLDILTLDTLCQPLNNVGVNVAGAKLIGTNPNIRKFNNSYVSVAGLIDLDDIEWDTYTPTLLAGQPYVVSGTSPIQSINVLPDSHQVFTLILAPSTPNSLLIIAKDAATGAPIEGASLTVDYNNAANDRDYGTTGGSVWVQNSWTGGAGQTSLNSKNKYWTNTSTIDINTNPEGVRLSKDGSSYPASGMVESSTYDTLSSATKYTTILWAPTSQSADTSVKFQVATNNDDTTWNFKGPDGTDSTYYTVPGTTINSIHNNNRYIRYRAFLETNDDKITPVLTSININYVLSCNAPGQSFFPGLGQSNNYKVIISKPGFDDITIDNVNVNGNQLLEINLHRNN